MSFKFEDSNYIPKEELDKLPEEEKKKALTKKALEESKLLNSELVNHPGLDDGFISSRKQPNAFSKFKTVAESAIASHQGKNNVFGSDEEKGAVDKSRTTKFIAQIAPPEDDPDDAFIKGALPDLKRKAKSQIMNEEQIITGADPWRKTHKEKTESEQNRKDLDKPYV